MTAKCCRECVKHSEHVGDRDYCQLWQSYIPGHPDTFYCSAFTRSSSAKVSVEQDKPLPSSIEQAQEDERYERTEKWPYVKRKENSAKPVGGKEETKPTMREELLNNLCPKCGTIHFPELPCTEDIPTIQRRFT
jgi:hypothetical protein